MALSTSPQGLSKRTITIDGKDYKIVREGLAEILVPADFAEKATAPTTNELEKAKGDPLQKSVFYNPIQQFNRDLSVLAIRVFAEDHALALDIKSKQDKIEGKSKPQKRKRRDTSAGDDEHKSKALKPGAPRLEGEDRALGEFARDSLASDAHNATAPPAEDEHHPEATVQSLAADTVEDHEKKQHKVVPIPTGPKPKANSSTPPKRPFRVLDALSATGLRALRYVLEIPQVTIAVANDLDPAATAAIGRNVAHNNVGSRVQPSTGNAAQHMYAVGTGLAPPSGSRTGRYHVIDLDPYGTAAPFLDGAIQALGDGGLLCVTCTDAGVFASTAYSEKAFSQYGGLPLKTPQAHEAGIRLVLHTIAVSASRGGMSVEPLLSLSIDYYVRLFVRLRHAPHEVKHVAAKTMLVYACDSGCGAWRLQYFGQQQERRNKLDVPWWKFSPPQAPAAEPFCEHCGLKTHLAGPMWGGPLHNPYFVQRMLEVLPTLSKETYGTIPRLEGMLTTARDETLLPTDFPPPVPVPDPAADLRAAQMQEPSAESRPDGGSAPAPIPRLPPSLRDPHPFFLYPSSLCRALSTPPVSNDALRGAMRRLGYRATRSHTKAGSLRTDAPWAVVWEVMRRWAQSQHAPGWAPQKAVGVALWRRGTQAGGVELARWKAELRDVEGRVDSVEGLKREVQALLWRMEKGEDAKDEAAKGAVAEDALAANGEAAGGPSDGVPIESANKDAAEDPVDAAAPPKEEKLTALKLAKLDIVFDESLGREEPRKGLVRYQANPAPNWGPMSKAR